MENVTPRNSETDVKNFKPENPKTASPNPKFKWTCLADGHICFSEILLLVFILCFVISLFFVKRFYHRRRRRLLSTSDAQEEEIKNDPYNSINDSHYMMKNNHTGSTESGLSGSYHRIHHSQNSGLNQICQTQNDSSLGSGITSKLFGSNVSGLSGSYQRIQDVSEGDEQGEIQVVREIVKNNSIRSTGSHGFLPTDQTPGGHLKSLNGVFNNRDYLDAVYAMKDVESDNDYLNPLHDTSDNEHVSIRDYRYKDFPRMCLNQKLISSV